MLMRVKMNFKRGEEMSEIERCCYMIGMSKLPLELVVGFSVNNVDILVDISNNINLILEENLTDYLGYESARIGPGYFNSIYQIKINVQDSYEIFYDLHDEIKDYIIRCSQILFKHYPYRIWYDLQNIYKDGKCQILLVTTIMNQQKCLHLEEIKNQKNKRKRNNSPSDDILHKLTKLNL